MKKVKVKICGIKDVTTALEAEKSGVDYIGLVFCEKSKRCITIEKAKEIISSLSKKTLIVALFSNDDEKYVSSIINSLDIDIVQFHGNELDSYCIKYNLPYFKGISERNNDFSSLDEIYPNSSAFIVDSHDGDGIGGTGKTFNWSKNHFNTKKPIIIAGGLNCDNVEDAIKVFLPYGVDVSSGVESSFGNKDTNLIREFIKKVKNAI